MSEDSLSKTSSSHADGVTHLVTLLRDRRLETPALVALEILRPFGFLLSQLLVMAEPMLGETLRRRATGYQRLLQDQGEMNRLMGLLASGASISGKSEEDPCQPSPS